MEEQVIYDQVRQTAKRDFVLRSRTASPRTILVPHAGDRDAPGRILAGEQAIRSQLGGAWREIRPSSQAVHGVDLEEGASCDYVVVNRHSHTKKALLHALAHPELADLEFARRLAPLDGSIDRLLLVSESACFDVTLPKSGEAQTDLALKKVLENTGQDFFGRVVDYLRDRFGESMPIPEPIRLQPAAGLRSPASEPGGGPASSTPS